MNTFGSRLKKLRTERGLSMDRLVEQLNERFGTSLNKSMISKWENDKEDATMPNVINISIFFNVSADYLLGISDTGIQTIAAHKENNEDWTEEELLEIEKYKLLLLSARINRK